MTDKKVVKEVISKDADGVGEKAVNKVVKAPKPKVTKSIDKSVTLLDELSAMKTLKSPRAKQVIAELIKLSLGAK